ncbi:MAG: CBS domain-containing protein [Candidatus Nanoarchaeia archaeon]|nr:CBS domain-containing protein [Candidatus Nanoarchaeia archaeon]
MRRTLAVAEMMSINPIKCRLEDNIVTVSKLMKKYNISSIVVCDENEVKGLITVDDIVQRVVANNENLETTKAKQVMTTDVVSVSPTKSVEEVIEVMNSNSISQLPVMQEKKLMGFVTMKDILRLEPALFDLFTKRLEDDEAERRRFIQKHTNVSSDDI